MIGQTISHYKILEKLGEGGMGVVYKALDINLDRIIALKFLPRQTVLTQEDKARFTQEAQAAARLNHPSVAMVYQFDEADDPTSGEKISFMAMEFVDGVTLTSKIEERPFRLEEVFRLACIVAEALSKAHSLGIVHRDIKSDNIMIAKDGSIKVMDFGLAAIAGRSRFTKVGTTLGTVAYMSPEQTKGEPVDRRSDIWSLGIVLYEIITGRRPFQGDYDHALMYQIVNVDPPPLTSLRSSVPTELELIMKKALQKDPESRYQHLDELLVDLRAAQSSFEGDRDSRTTTSKWNARHQTLSRTFIASGVLIVLAVVVIMFLKSRRIDSPHQILSIAVLPFVDHSQKHD
jgi:serine/threonine protein kinase